MGMRIGMRGAQGSFADIPAALAFDAASGEMATGGST
jgi:hypothetical protein